MIQVRKSGDRGHANHGWLDSHHTFSFGNYYDPRFTGFRDLLVINEDRVAPGMGFGRHGHRDMEIISYVLDGALEHKDSMGTGSVIRPGDVQRMSAGTGVMHSEFNHSKEEPLHFLQIWIQPQERGIAPGYEEKSFSREEKKNRLRLIASPDGRENSVRIHQDAFIHSSILEAGSALDFQPVVGRGLWLQLIRGSLDVNGIEIRTGDGLAIEDEKSLKIAAKESSEFLVFDLR